MKEETATPIAIGFTLKANTPNKKPRNGISNHAAYTLKKDIDRKYFMNTFSPD
jgi:hypothetical protein